MLSVNIATAGNPPPSGTHPAGPAIIAEMTFTPIEEYTYEDEYENVITVYDVVAFEGTGTCGGSPVIIPYDDSLAKDHQFDAVNKDSLLDFTVTFPTGWPMALDDEPADCIPTDKEGNFIAIGMIIRAVTDFIDHGTYKWAKVILLFTVPK